MAEIPTQDQVIEHCKKSGTAHVVGFSGGIDSQACARWVLNRFDPLTVLLVNSDAGGNEHPMTTEFIRSYSAKIHPVVEIHAIIADLEDIRVKERKEYKGEDELMMFDDLAKIVGIFPWRRRQFCTYHLKIVPQKRWFEKHLSGVECIRYAGVRRDESLARAETPITQFNPYFDCQLVHPIADWTKKMCFDYCEHHGEEVNGLYKLGFKRVGCAPCVNSTKDDILEWAMRAPEMIDKVREWEKRVGKTFFSPRVPGLPMNWIDDVVEWSKTARGGRVLDESRTAERPACESKYGLCDN
jgi:3'-phosphoadenosine 5'-phosphosulfate sulfotransferase (PAPS reductase)/FAD synthetase